MKCIYCGSNDVMKVKKGFYCQDCGKTFEAEEEKKEFKPMKLFLSYGHPEEEICLKIKEALEKRGHEVWFDKQNIKHGDDWRCEIEKGINSSNGVISCLSKHSVRDPGVCLDELSIAVGCKGGNIQTVLLENENDINIPASVCHLQWVNLSEWKSKINTDDFEKWFDFQMNNLFSVIEDDRYANFEGEITKIYRKLNVNLDTGKQNALLRKKFIGRKWLTEDIVSWLDNPEGERMCILYGDPGIGKSAFAANFTHYNPKVAASIFCEYDKPHFNEPKTVIETLAYLLACRIPEYRKLLTYKIESTDIYKLNESELFATLLSEPLRLTVDGGHETLCIVIDGLDECGDSDKNALAYVLSKYTEQLPKWLRVLVTARRVAAVKNILIDVPTFELDGNNVNNKNDVKTFFEEKLNDFKDKAKSFDESVKILTERSGGIFLYAELICDAIIKGKLSIDGYSEFPTGLDTTFNRWFQWFFPDIKEYKEKFRLPIGVIAYSPEPIPADELKVIFGWGENGLDDFMRIIGVLVRRETNIFGKNTVAFSHKYLVDWLESENCDYKSSKNDALKTVANAFYERYKKEGGDKLTEFEALYLAKLLKKYENEDGFADKCREVGKDKEFTDRICEIGINCFNNFKYDEAIYAYQIAADMPCINGAEKGRIYYIIGTLYNKKGEYDRAHKSFLGALEIYKMAGEENSFLVSATYNNIGMNYRDKGELDKALDNLIKALKLENEIFVDNHNKATTINNIGLVYRDKGESDKALDNLTKALELEKEIFGENSCFCKEIYNNIGSVYADKGETDKALEYHSKSLEIRKTYGENSLIVAKCYNNLGCDYCDKGEYDTAIYYILKALEIYKATVGENNPDMAGSYNNIGLVYHYKGEFNTSLDYFFKALEILKATVRENDPGTALSYYNIGLIYIDKGELDKALEYLMKAYKIYQPLYGDGASATKEVCWNIAVTHLKTGNLKKALNFRSLSGRLSWGKIGE